MGGGGKSNEMQEGLFTFANSVWEASKKPFKKGMNTLSQLFNTGAVQARTPEVQKSVQEAGAASSQALSGAEEEMARYGLTGTPYGQRTLSDLRLKSNMQIGGIPSDIRRRDYEFLMNLLWPGATGGVNTAGQGFGGLVQAEVAGNQSWNDLYGTLFSSAAGILGQAANASGKDSKSSGGGQQTSDVHAKENFSDIDPYEVLDKVSVMPITTWNYKEDPGTRHIGPMAQDFRAAFEVGVDDKSIFFLDEGGVALAAIQALYRRVKELEDTVRRLT